MLYASAPLREAVRQPGNAAAAAAAPQAIVDGLRRAAEAAAANPLGVRTQSMACIALERTPAVV